MSAIGNIASTLLHAVLPVNLFPNNATTTSVPVSGSSSVTQAPDSGRLSPFAQLVSTLQQLQQSNPAQFQQVASQIATNLKSAAQSAQSSGNPVAAGQLNQLATDFTSASATGQLPNLQDLAQALSAGHPHHSRFPSDSSDNGAPQATTRFTASGQSSVAPNSSVNAATIIQNTLSSAGIGTIG
jgi:hypothetical protein